MFKFSGLAWSDPDATDATDAKKPLIHAKLETIVQSYSCRKCVDNSNLLDPFLAACSAVNLWTL